jgi:hypothetical protein
MVNLESMEMMSSRWRCIFKIMLNVDTLLQYVNTCKTNYIDAGMLGKSREDFRCPKTGRVPVAPVSASDGYIYDYDHLKKMLEEGSTSLFTGQTLEKQIYPAFLQVPHDEEGEVHWGSFFFSFLWKEEKDVTLSL